MYYGAWQTDKWCGGCASRFAATLTGLCNIIYVDLARSKYTQCSDAACKF